LIASINFSNFPAAAFLRSNQYMTNSRLNPPDEPEPTSQPSGDKSEVRPLFLTEKEERTTPEHQPKGLQNPFWHS
jgi:hypothetical protein